MIVVKHVDSIFGSLLPIRLSTFKLVSNLPHAFEFCIIKAWYWVDGDTFRTFLCIGHKGKGLKYKCFFMCKQQQTPKLYVLLICMDMATI